MTLQSLQQYLKDFISFVTGNLLLCLDFIKSHFVKELQLLLTLCLLVQKDICHPPVFHM